MLTKNSIIYMNMLYYFIRVCKEIIYRFRTVFMEGVFGVDDGCSVRGGANDE